MVYAARSEIAGRTLTIETGRFAEQANGAVIVQYGDTVVLVTACRSNEIREGVDFVPLTIDYEERLYAAGKIPGSFFRREGRPTTEAVLICRITDRPLRPLFPKDFRQEVQVIVTVFSADLENSPDILAIIGASSALGISDIPFGGPVAASRVGYIEGEFVLNPTYSQLQNSKMDLVMVGTKDGVVMVEAGLKEVPEDIVVEAIKFGQMANKDVLELQEKLISDCGIPKIDMRLKEPVSTLHAEVTEILRERIGSGPNWRSQKERKEGVSLLRNEIETKFGNGHTAQEISTAFDAGLKEVVRTNILEKGIRPDGRGLTDIRTIKSEVGVFPRTHGSGLFSRGQTQVLTIATLGSPREEQQIDGIGQEETKRYMHHYNYPPFSNGEVKRISTPGRREIGHGALAERALVPVLPEESEFPYTVRLVSEVLSSNGSTSMASVCGSTLSLMDAGVPIKRPVAGVAMGLVTDSEGRYALLTDIQGLEDALGDMDFKVAGTTEGITALQMDIKISSIDYDILSQGLLQAREARMSILDKMKQTIGESRPAISKYAPRLTKIMIDPDKVRHVIGPGGKTIRAITTEADVTIDIENDGTILIGATSEEATLKAIQMIEDLTREVEVNGIYSGKVTRTTNFGAFVEILPGKEGLVHISELADYRAPSVEDVVKVGDEITVIVTEIDQMGRINLSRRALLLGEGQPSGDSVQPRRKYSGDHPPYSQNKMHRNPPNRDRGMQRGGPQRRPPRE